jgi:hypothetical protein
MKKKKNRQQKIITANLGTIEKNAVTAIGAPSYVSGAQA